MSDIEQPAALCFSVGIDGLAEHAVFEEIQGLGAEVEAETVTEGGQNRFVHKPPAHRQRTLTVKRGSASGDLVKWFEQTLGGALSRPLMVHDIVVDLLDSNGKALVEWRVHGAYPVRWTIADGSPTGEQVAIEVMEFAYASFTRKA